MSMGIMNCRTDGKQNHSCIFYCDHQAESILCVLEVNRALLNSGAISKVSSLRLTSWCWETDPGITPLKNELIDIS